MAKKFFFLPALTFGLQKLALFLPALFSLSVRLRRTLTCLPARQVKNALAKEKNNPFPLYTNSLL